MEESSYSFPILSSRSIVDCFQELKIDVNLSQLENPDTEFIRHVLVCSMERLVGIKVDQYLLSKNTFVTETYFKHPSLQQVSLQVVEFFFLIRDYFLDKIGYSEKFSLQFLVEPSKTDTRELCSAIIAFAQFKTSEDQKLENHNEEKMRVQRRKVTLEEKYTELQERLEKEERRVEEDKYLAEDLEHEIKNLKDSLVESQKRMDQANENLRSSKKNLYQQKQKRRIATETINEKRREKERLDFAIREGLPQDFENKLEDLENEEGRISQEIEELMDRKRQLLQDIQGESENKEHMERVKDMYDKFIGKVLEKEKRMEYERVMEIRNKTDKMGEDKIKLMNERSKRIQEHNEFMYQHLEKIRQLENSVKNYVGNVRKNM